MIEESEAETFFKDNDVILINLQYQQFTNKFSDSFRYLELPETAGHVIDFKNKIVVDLEEY